MKIKSLRLENFRNYIYLNEEFDENVNVLYGFNGQGKTNILESIYLCAAGRSHRTSHDIELINMEKDNFHIDLFFDSENGDQEIDFTYNRAKQKIIKINDICIKKIGNLIGNLVVVMFSPEDLMLVKNGPSVRRRFIDISLSQIRPSYFFDLQQYNRILSQRNVLLKDLKRNRSLNDLLEAWNESLINVGARIIKKRLKFIKSLSEYICDNHAFISEGKEQLTIKYIPSVSVNNSENYETLSEDDIKEMFSAKLSKNLDVDIERESTTAGPHRDDFIYKLNGYDLKQYGSQGQQRTAVLSTKLAELKIMEDSINDKPILLLDDVMSELDNKRQEFLFNKVNGIQTFITCTDENTVKNVLKTGSKYFLISDGVINKKEK